MPAGLGGQDCPCTKDAVADRARTPTSVETFMLPASCTGNAKLSPAQLGDEGDARAASVGPVQAQGFREKDRHLPALDVGVRTEVPAAAPGRDPGGVERLDELMVLAAERHVVEGREVRRRADL